MVFVYEILLYTMMQTYMLLSYLNIYNHTSFMSAFGHFIALSHVILLICRITELMSHYIALSHELLLICRITELVSHYIALSHVLLLLSN